MRRTFLEATPAAATARSVFMSRSVCEPRRAARVYRYEYHTVPVPVRRHRGEPGHTRDTRTHNGTRTTQTYRVPVKRHRGSRPQVYVGPVPVLIVFSPPFFPPGVGKTRSLSGLQRKTGTSRKKHAPLWNPVHQHGRAGFRRCPRQSPLRMPRRRNPPGVPSPCCSNLRLGPTAYSCRSRG